MIKRFRLERHRTGTIRINTRDDGNLFWLPEGGGEGFDALMKVAPVIYVEIDDECPTCKRRFEV